MCNRPLTSSPKTRPADGWEPGRSVNASVRTLRRTKVRAHDCERDVFPCRSTPLKGERSVDPPGTARERQQPSSACYRQFASPTIFRDATPERAEVAEVSRDLEEAVGIGGDGPRVAHGEPPAFGLPPTCPASTPLSVLCHHPSRRVAEPQPNSSLKQTWPVTL